MTAHTITKLSDLFDVLRSYKKVIVDVHALNWCAPCRMIAPLFDELAASYTSHIHFVKVDVDTAEHLLCNALQVSTVPMFITFVDGKEFDRFRGADKVKLRMMVQNLSNH